MRHLFLAATFILAVPVINADEPDTKALNMEAKTVVKQFASVLKPALKKALQSDGPAKAIEVCSEVAPATAASVAANSGWQVKRVSLKTRNNKTATPDDWERKILEQFDARQASGEDVGPMMYSEVVDDEFRFIKAQGVEQVCTVCHGTNIKPEVQEALTEFYPADTATGYELGEVRGAFSLKKKLD
jgi:hypothetical protein